MGEVIDLEAERQARAQVRARRDKALRDAERPPPDGRDPGGEPPRPGCDGESTPR